MLMYHSISVSQVLVKCTRFSFLGHILQVNKWIQKNLIMGTAYTMSIHLIIIAIPEEIHLSGVTLGKDTIIVR